MTQYPAAEALLLVCVIPSPRDMEIARLLGWYRIPLRSAPRVIAVDYLAFYQTGAYGEKDRWQIASFAQVKGYEMVKRQDLFRDEPHHPRAQEEYFKISLGPLERMDSPILADKWKRITFLYTTGTLFREAKTIHELIVREEERSLLWRSLRERASVGGVYLANDLPEMDVDPVLLAALGWLALPDRHNAAGKG